MYLREMGTVPLLTREGEVEIARAHRARQAVGHQVDLAHADGHQEGHPARRRPEERRSARSASWSPSRTRSSPTTSSRIASAKCCGRSTPSARRASRCRRPRRSSSRSRRRTSSKYRRAAGRCCARRVELSQPHPRDRVHRAGEAPADRGDQGPGRGRPAHAARDRRVERQLNPKNEEARSSRKKTKNAAQAA